MNYVGPSDASATLTTLMTVALVISLGVTMVGSLFVERRRLSMTLFITGIATAAVICLVGHHLINQVRDGDGKHRTESIVDRYGWEPTSEQLSELKYPNSAPEVGVHVLYGHTALDAGGDTITVQLAWDGEQLLLLDVSDAQELNIRS